MNDLSHRKPQANASDKENHGRHKGVSSRPKSPARKNGRMVRDTGFEPVTPSVSGRCSTTELTALGLSSGAANV